MAENEMESIKAIIDFSKTVIGICSGILTAVIGFLVYQQTELEWFHYAILSGFVLSLFISLRGFGCAIAALRDTTSSNSAICFTNIGAIIIILSTSLLATFRIVEKESIDMILKHIEESTKTTNKKLS